MRLVKLGLLSGFAALVALGSMDSAEAGSRWKSGITTSYPEYESILSGSHLHSAAALLAQI